MQETKYREAMNTKARRELYEELTGRYDAAILDGMVNEWLSPDFRGPEPLKYGNFTYRNGWVYFDRVVMSLVDGAIVEEPMPERRRFGGDMQAHQRVRQFAVTVLRLEADLKEAAYVASLYDGTLATLTPMYAIGIVYVSGVMVAVAEALGARRVSDEERENRRLGDTTVIKVPPNIEMTARHRGEFLYLEFPDFEAINRFNTVRELMEVALLEQYKIGSEEGGNLLMALHKGTMTIENFNQSWATKQDARTHRLA